MTFSGLPSVRDPKQSLKNSSSSSPSSSSNGSSSSSSSSPVKSPLTTPSNVDPTTSPQNSTQGHPVVVATEGMMNRHSVEKSFEELVQSNFMDRPIGPGVSQANNTFLPTTSPTFQELQVQQQMPVPVPVSTPPAPAPTVTKKKAAPTSILDPTQHAAYRKRLNVNQVCDWCRYRKIRCDRESPCNSCIHSKRECIRSPPSALIGNTPEESETSTKKTKRNRTEDKDGRRTKSYRGSSTSSQRSSSYNSNSSPDTDDEGSEASGARSSLSPVVGSTLAGLSLSSLGLGLLGTRRDSDFSNTPSFALGNSLQDQEHLHRVRRIEVFLCNVIPGAAEFIANGTQPPINPSNTNCDQPLSLITQGLENSAAFKDLLSSQERFANISLNSPSVATSSKTSWLPANLPTLQEEGPSESTSQQPSSFDHIERMKRIELLLSSISDMPLAKALTHSQGSQGDRKKKDDKKGSKKDSKKSNKGDVKKNNNGNVVKRPHVAAGFAGQKPPPKLPQAIAEAANKKQAIRKKRVSAAAAARAAAKAAAAGTSGTNSDQGLVVSSPGTVASPANSEAFSVANTFASLEIPSALDAQAMPFPQQDHHQDMFVQQQHQLQMDQHRGSSFPANPPFGQSHAYQLTMSNVNSMTIPLSDPISSYGSLVVPASSSTCSSSQSSPTLAQAEAIGQGHDGYQEENMSTDGAGPVNEMMYPQQGHIQVPYGAPTSQYQQQQHNTLKPGNNASEYNMGFDLMSQVLTAPQQSILGIEAQIHPFAQGASTHQQHQQLHRQSIQIGEGGFTDFGLNMDESLESLMKKNMGSLHGLASNLPNDAHSLQHPQASHPHHPSQLHGGSVSTASSIPILQSTPGYENMYDAAAQFGYFEQQGQSNSSLIQTGISRPQHPFTPSEAPRPMWFPNQSGSFNVPASIPEFSWSSQQQSSQSINISANDSPEVELESLDLDMENDDNNQAQDHPSALQHIQLKQQPLSAHALFQQQHVQQQQRHMEQQALQQQQQMQQIHQQQQQKQLHRVSIQHQHQQTFYIPQMQDDDEELEFEPVSSSVAKSK